MKFCKKMNCQKGLLDFQLVLGERLEAMEKIDLAYRHKAIAQADTSLASRVESELEVYC